MPRCPWAGDDPLMRAYHDDEWGVPLHDDRRLFELLILEGMQAGLSWSTILHKRSNFRRAFDRFNPVKIARYDSRDVARLLADPGIIRNRLKIEGSITNAKLYRAVQKEFGTFDAYCQQFTQGNPIRRRPSSADEVPVATEESDAMSRDLRARGFKFVGSTICYAFMQATGMVDDHLAGCFKGGKR